MSSAVTTADQEIKAVPQGAMGGPLHTVILVMLLIGGAGLMYFSARHVQGTQQPNRVSFYLTTMAWEWFLTGYVLLGVRRHGKSLVEVTGARWNSGKEVVRDIGIALAFWVVALMALRLTASLLRFQGSQHTLRALAPESPAQTITWILLCITAGFCEETIFRGYLQKQFIAWTGNVPVGVFLSAAIFGACHIYQGAKAVVLIAVYGTLFGVLAQRRKSLRPGMITHALHNTASGLAMKLLPK